MRENSREADGDSSSDEYLEQKTTRNTRKRRKLSRRSTQTSAPSVKTKPNTGLISSKSLFGPLLEVISSVNAEEDVSFDEFVEPLLPDLIDASAMAQVEKIQYDNFGQQVIPMSRLQTAQTLDKLSALDQSPAHALLRRKLLSSMDSFRAHALGMVQRSALAPGNEPLTIMSVPRGTPPNPEVIDALESIKTTPYESSFLSRLHGFQLPPKGPGCLAVDWDNRTPWMDLMLDIREHFSLMHPEREQPEQVEAPIEYVTLQPWHLPQVHTLLTRAFWPGIDVSDALQYSPERCTVIAMYKKMIVGAALLSSPIETYITYLVVKPGWDNSQIATSMLYHLITLNPHKDITLHVSINNPAVLLYNRFGFKAEEFIVGFYEDYLDSQSRASKNAFRLRLRR